MSLQYWVANWHSGHLANIQTVNHAAAAATARQVVHFVICERLISVHLHFIVWRRKPDCCVLRLFGLMSGGLPLFIFECTTTLTSRVENCVDVVYCILRTKQCAREHFSRLGVVLKVIFHWSGCSEISCTNCNSRLLKYGNMLETENKSHRYDLLKRLSFIGFGFSIGMAHVLMCIDGLENCERYWTEPLLHQIHRERYSFSKNGLLSDIPTPNPKTWNE